MRALIALDFSDCSRLACRWAIEHAPRLGTTELIFHHVLDDGDSALGEIEDCVGRVREFVAKELGERSLDGIGLRYSVGRGRTAQEVIDAARQTRADLIVTGTNARTGLDRLVLGSVAELIVRMAPCTVVVVKPGPQ